jgi:glycolate oxidase
MRIKSVFDPQWLLNAGKVFPLEAAETQEAPAESAHRAA